MCPIPSMNSGMQFPLEGCSGKRIPFRSSIPGRIFRLRLYGKAYPTLGIDSGMQFPLEGPSGKRIPLWSRIPGRGFRSKQKAPTRDGAGAKGTAYAVDVERGRPVSNAVRPPPYPRLRARLYGVSAIGRSGRSLPSNAR